MEYIKGRIGFISELQIVHKNNDSFNKVILVIKKTIDKKNRNIAFECYGKLAERIHKQSRLNDKVEIEYIIQSHVSKIGIWYTNLIAKSVEKPLNYKKIDINQAQLL